MCAAGIGRRSVHTCPAACVPGNVRGLTIWSKHCASEPGVRDWVAKYVGRPGGHGVCAWSSTRLASSRRAVHVARVCLGRWRGTLRPPVLSATLPPCVRARAMARGAASVTADMSFPCRPGRALIALTSSVGSVVRVCLSMGQGEGRIPFPWRSRAAGAGRGPSFQRFPHGQGITASGAMLCRAHLCASARSLGHRLGLDDGCL